MHGNKSIDIIERIGNLPIPTQVLQRINAIMADPG
jgi:hypothetical protein